MLPFCPVPAPATTSVSLLPHRYHYDADPLHLFRFLLLGVRAGKIAVFLKAEKSSRQMSLGNKTLTIAECHCEFLLGIVDLPKSLA